MKGVDRRGFLKFLGGAAVGTMATPMPWKLLDDVSIWTQNWSWMARLPRGPLTIAHRPCLACPEGCLLRLRCVGGVPYGVTSVPGHPDGRGAPCTLGLTAHHLPHHPRRLKTALMRPAGGAPGRLEAVGTDAALRELSRWVVEARGGDGTVAVLDGAPGRVVSLAYRRFLAAMPDGVYLVAPGPHATFLALDRMLEGWDEDAGLDLERTRTLMSFGAPVREEWAGSGLWASLRRTAAGPPHLIQAETRPSRTALAADRWLRLQPGTEAALALGLANLIAREREAKGRDPYPARVRRSAGADVYRRLVAAHSPERTAEVTGISTAELVETARRLVNDGPSLVVAGSDPGGGSFERDVQSAVWALNVMLESVGEPGGIVPRRVLPAPEGFGSADGVPTVRLEEVADGSIRLLVIDPTAAGPVPPWELVRRKLVPGVGRVACLSPFDTGPARRADLVIPAPAAWEDWDEAPTPPGAPKAAWLVSAPLLTAPAEVVAPYEVALRLGAEAGAPEGVPASAEAALEARAEAIRASGRGTVFDPNAGRTRPLADSGSGSRLWRALCEGAMWLDDPGPTPGVPAVALLGPEAVSGGWLRDDGRPSTSPSRPHFLMPYGRAVASLAAASPVFAKIQRESPLHHPGGAAVIHPETARELGLRHRDIAMVETDRGTAPVRIDVDPIALPGVVHVAMGPDTTELGERSVDPAGPDGQGIFEITDPAEAGTWRLAPARLREA